MRYAFALLALAQLAIGAAAIFARFALTGGDPIAVSALRLIIAAVPVGLIAAARGAYRSYDRATEQRLALAGVALAIHFACWIASLRYASVAVSTLLVCTTPIWTEAFAIVRLRRIRPAAAVSIGCALLGVAIVVGVPDRNETPLGIGLALAGAVAIAVYLLLVRASDPRYGTLAVVARTYPAAAVVLLAAALIAHDRLPGTGDPAAWAGIVAMALVSQLFGHTALNAAVRRLSATLVATVTLIEPAIAGVLAALIFGERLAPGTLAGALIVLAGIALAVRAEPRATAELAVNHGT
ncbi:MAG: DMT family transporter [Candidatus Velthaea sp.]|jgi:drug/metabolite transporter (DMT)-like permease